MKKFDSDFLNEQLNNGRLEIKTGIFAEGLKAIHKCEPDAIVVEVFPIANFQKILEEEKDSNKLRTKIVYQLKKEGFKFFSVNVKSVGFYIK